MWSWADPRLEVRASEIHKRGVFTRSAIAKNERIAIFGGAIMLIDEIDDLPEHLQDYPLQIEERFVLGLRDEWQPETADYFNHSCNPNCGFRGQIFLVAIRDISPNEELTFDYAMVISISVDSHIVFEMECLCGSPNCRHNITEQDWKLPELQHRYAGYFSQYLAEKIEVEKHQSQPGLAERRMKSK